MRVLFLASEVAPHSKTGGLADVAAALPARLRTLGHDVRTVTPFYRGIVTATDLRDDGELKLRLGTGTIRARLLADPSTATWLVDAPPLFGGGALYTDRPDEPLRFAALTLAGLESCRHLDWDPQIVHANDWQTALAPVFLRSAYAADTTLGGCPTVLTIHNLAYQGVFAAEVASELALANELLDADDLAAGRINFLRLGLEHADALTTVSPGYAAEIQLPEAGRGLDEVLRRRAGRLTGILNGIDTSVWDPSRDHLIPYRYSARSLWRKEWDKRALLERLGLPYRRGVPVVGMVTRLVEQKGIDLLPGPLGHFLDSWDLRLTVLGSGEPRYEGFFRDLATRHPDRVAFRGGYDEGLAHLIEAGADIFLMPSQYEPCGLNQMYSLAYGTIPVVRKVGGLADTVRHFDPGSGEGTGFVFEHYTEDGLGWALGQALGTHTDPALWRRLQQNAMSEDNSWERRAVEYADLYRRTVSAHP